MSQVVQARCPSCQHVLRIPAAWLNQTVRCTNCKAMFQAKSRAPASPAASLKSTPPPPPAKLPISLPAAPPAPAPRAAAAPPPAPRVAPLPFAKPAAAEGGPQSAFSFEPVARATPRKPRSSFLSGALLWVGVAIVGGALAFLAWPEISGLFQGSKSDDRDKKVAAADKAEVKDGDPPKKTIEPDADKKTSDKKTSDKKADKSSDDKAVKDKTDETDKAPVVPPVKEEEPKKKEVAKKKEIPPPAKGDFPRRALLINVSNYLLFNPLFYGLDLDRKKPGGSTGAVAERLGLPPMNFPRAQIFELADGKAGGHGTTKSIIESAIADFLITAREQDRVVLLFTGHGMEIDSEAYLVPADGNRKNADSLIKLSWVYDRFKECKARQKVLILDVFRFPPARGEEIDGTGAMTEAFVAKLNNAPPGVQVWASCSKDQQSIELENGSLFLQAINQATRELALGIARPEEAIPVEELLPLVNKTLKSRLAGKHEQVSLMVGKEEPGKAFDGSEPPAAPITFKDPGGADPKLRLATQAILDELNLLPSLRGARPPIPASSVMPFITAKIRDFDPDAALSIKEMQKLVMAEPEKHPLRTAYFEAAEVLKECAKFPIMPYQASPITDMVKKTIEALQKEQPGLLDFKLKQVQAKMRELDETKRDEETSRRWLAHFDYARVMIDAKIVFLNEYNYNLASLRSTDRMPELEGAPGWRLGSAKSLSTKEGPIKSLNKKLPKMWDKIANDYKETPWAILASRESMTAMGMEWRAAKE